MSIYNVSTLLYAGHSGCSHGDVCLINGSTMFEGRVEFCYRGMWGSICDNFWDDRDAAVVCQQLHFQSSSMHLILIMDILSL